MGLCLAAEKSDQVVPTFDLGNLNREEDPAVPYQDTWIDGELDEITDETSCYVVVDFGSSVRIKVKLKNVRISDVEREDLKERLPTRIKLKPISWEKDGRELLAEVRKRSIDKGTETGPPDSLFN
uniref:Uncharacterized protein n=1 Tax=viral metagenome TaxID=1070528 RepID=A0A6C0CHI8_9ZZZZ